MNLPFYGPATTAGVALDPSARLLSIAEEASTRGTSGIALLKASAEAIPLDDKSIDTVVTTWTLCTIPDVVRALREVQRVLRSGGRLLFVEHGRSPDDGVRRWQERLTPIRRHIGGGCHLNRPIPELLEHAGFHIDRMETGYMQGPKPMTFTYQGSARPA